MCKANTSRIQYFDILNIAACFAVILLHTGESVWTFSTLPYWKRSMWVQTLFYWAVPIFFMLSGATLIDYRDRYCTAVFFKKRIIRVGIPYIFWSVFSIYWAINISHWLPSDINLSFSSIIDIILNCKGLSIYWFFIPLFSCYCSIPFLSLIEKPKRIRGYSYIFIYSFITYSVLPVIFRFYGVSINMSIMNPVGGGYILYILLGYLLANIDLKKPVRIIIYILGLFGWLFRFITTVNISTAIGRMDTTYSDYLHFYSVFLASAIFVFFKYNRVINKRTFERYRKILRTLSSASFGIYLIHYYILRFFVDNLHINYFSTKWQLMGPFVIYGISLLIVLALKKIPFVKKIVP